jgi:hypothetical protein
LSLTFVCRLSAFISNSASWSSRAFSFFMHTFDA